RRECADRTSTNMEYTEKITALKKEKARAKMNFTRAQNKLSSLLEEDQPSRQTVQDVCSSLDTRLEHAMVVMEKLSDFYKKNGELDKGSKVVTEMEKLEVEFSAASETAREYLDTRRDERSSVTSETLTIDMLNQLRIHDDSETYKKQLLPQVTSQYPYRPTALANSYTQHSMSGEQSGVTNSKWAETVIRPETRTLPNENGFNATRTVNTMNSNDATSTQTESSIQPSIGQDLWRQLKRVQIPVFSGNKRTYQSWKAAFIACIDSAPATGEYKLLQLRQYLSGEALAVIDNLGHSATAYEAAKERLERKYGGRRRQIAIYLDELEQFRQVRPGFANDLDKFADLLDIAIINLKEAGQYHELEDGSLYTKLQRKLPEGMLARYHRWIFENQQQESVTALRTWVIQEAEFQTIAAETVHGFTGNERPIIRYKSQRTFLETLKETKPLKSCFAGYVIKHMVYGTAQPLCNIAYLIGGT
ncbi:MAG: DUF1759 domain-containing protein, partial [Candidatus Thiodiazotropha endolucinida]|nr:DUF1759 domain-containing protein [Candidatus Thiodiazotropha taylori]MCW4346824.1 DUF1759 domain-containing protein [Candidatus Thiodiazotropha endolucinida]